MFVDVICCDGLCYGFWVVNFDDFVNVVIVGEFKCFLFLFWCVFVVDDMVGVEGF